MYYLRVLISNNKSNVYKGNLAIPPPKKKNQGAKVT